MWPWYTVVLSGSSLKRMYTACAKRRRTKQAKAHEVNTWTTALIKNKEAVVKILSVTLLHNSLLGYKNATKHTMNAAVFDETTTTHD